MHAPRAHYVQSNSLPETFDPRMTYPNSTSMNTVLNQVRRLPWVFFPIVPVGIMRLLLDIRNNRHLHPRTSGVVSDRLYRAGLSNTILAPQFLVDCCQTCYPQGDGLGHATCNNGCTGGWIERAFHFMTTNRQLPTESCLPYEAKEVNCSSRSQCADGKPLATVTLPDSFGYAFMSDEAQIMEEIVTRGSVAVTFRVFADMYLYAAGIYRHVAGAHVGNHAVKLVGYGTENGTKYWLGFFRILRGANECGIEADVWAPYVSAPAVARPGCVFNERNGTVIPVSFANHTLRACHQVSHDACVLGTVWNMDYYAGVLAASFDDGTASCSNAARAYFCGMAFPRVAAGAGLPPCKRTCEGFVGSCMAQTIYCGGLPDNPGVDCTLVDPVAPRQASCPQGCTSVGTLDLGVCTGLLEYGHTCVSDNAAAQAAVQEVLRLPTITPAATRTRGCVAALQRLACAIGYPRCEATMGNVSTVCPSTCAAAEKACGMSGLLCDWQYTASPVCSLTASIPTPTPSPALLETPWWVALVAGLCAVLLGSVATGLVVGLVVRASMKSKARASSTLSQTLVPNPVGRV
ncbi:putative cathepsin B5 cysteine protease [Paratrimastix pyriformis]|uniref:Cathepsin B5 cysteine protease n=1 Tax=Paratrimastix pyriformis TaxID=342808 RepID=A0ABQ8UQ22_9EUKA|nr:putative cathepsin B5 cysteine protease [Paratrimastix pyriformis]